MNWIAKLLRWLRVIPSFTQDDVLNAENEDALLEHRKVVDELASATRLRKEINGRLRRVLTEATSARALSSMHTRRHHGQ